MLKLIVSGYNGRMGKVITRMCEESEDITIAAGFDINTEKTSDFPVYAAPMEFSGTADVVIDFSNTSALQTLLPYCCKRNLPIVLCTTGYSEEDMQMINDAAKVIPIFKSANMSLGINVMMDLIKRAIAILGTDYDIEIVEYHHNKKLDAPSGTALMLADAAASASPLDCEYVYDRHSVRKARDKNEIGISAIRGGTIVGEHEIILAGPDEVLKINHSIISREVFAAGAIRAARFLPGHAPGIYTMDDLIKE